LNEKSLEGERGTTLTVVLFALRNEGGSPQKFVILGH
jgi:hypothetical protein